jgi:cytoskeletal protein CcmA (bactofilin family)
VQGDVTAQALDIEAGAHFVGYSHTGENIDSTPKAIADQTATVITPTA